MLKLGMTARAKLMYILALTLIMFIGVIAISVMPDSPAGVGIMLAVFLVTVIIVLSDTAPEPLAKNVLIEEHWGGEVDSGQPETVVVVEEGAFVTSDSVTEVDGR